MIHRNMTTFIVQLLAFYSVWHASVVHCEQCDILPDLSLIQKCCFSPNMEELDLSEGCDEEAVSMFEFAECYFKKMNAITDGKPNISVLKKLAKPVLANNSGWELLFDSLVDKCMADVNAKHEETQKRVSEPPFNANNVNTMYLHLMTCIDVKLLLECPAENREDNTECNDFREVIENCSKDFPPRYFA